MPCQLISVLRKFYRDESGASAIEYALLASLVAAVIVAIVGLLGGQVKIAYCAVVTAMSGSCP
ncbi:MAG: Flp family type IVb pilin [Pseudomonadota bacterium]